MQPMVLVAVVAAGEITAMAAAHMPGTLDRPTGEVIPYPFDSGVVAGVAGGPGFFAEVVRVRRASWLRLHFDRVELAPGSVVRITSLADGEQQVLDAPRAAAWGNSTAYFNGDAVLVELVAAAGSAGDRLVLAAVSKSAARGLQPTGSAGGCGICDGDDRVPSSEPWAARLLPAGCTASVFDEAGCMVTAGHCIQPGSVVQFNVPGSNPDCSINNPPVADQFPIAVTESANGGVGNDWAVLIPGPNSLGELPFDRYHAMRPIAAVVPPPGTTAAVWGYGVDDTCTRSQTQQTDGGSIVGLDATTILWTIDIRGGNSGSAIIHDGGIVGIVTHCDPAGCPAAPNLGTRIDLPTFAAARNALCGGSLAFAFPGGLPELVAPDGSTTTRVVIDADSAVPAEGSGALHASVDGGPFVATSMAATAANEYVATFPAADCGAVVEYYFTALTTDGVQISSPPSAPADRHAAVAGGQLVTVFVDDFQADQGWSVTGTATDGHWQRGVPIPNSTCDRGNPGADGDGSGACFLTDNSAAGACNSDVDGGGTILTSPVLDAGEPAMVFEYRRWFSTTAGSSAFQDVFRVEISVDDGVSWSALELVGPGGVEVDGGWRRRVWRVPAPTGALRVRFIAADADPPSVVEAGVDGFALRSVVCDAACEWDLDGGGDVGIGDFLTLLAAWGAGSGGPPDFDGDGVVGIADFLELLAHWGVCPTR